MKQCLVLGLVCATLTPGCDFAARQPLAGTGSTFVRPVMAEWAAAFQTDKGVKVSYEAVGSSAGVQRLSPGIFDFACSDVPLTADQLEKLRPRAGDVVQVPVVLGAVVPAYNVPGLKDPVVFSGPVLAGIYLGTLKKWNAPELAALNPGAALPDLDITPLHRTDGSGTSHIFTQYLNRASPEWKADLVGTSITWPAGIGVPGSDAAITMIKGKPGSIGYVPLSYTAGQDVQVGLVKNRDGEVIKASAASVTAAAKTVLSQVGDDLGFSLVDAPGKESYPLSGATWAIICRQPGSRGKVVAEFFHWVTHDGQDRVEALHYARLPAELVAKVEKKLAAVWASP